MQEILKNKKYTVWLEFVFILLAACLLRCWHLGEAPFRADTVEFYKLSVAGQSIVELWKNPPWFNQIPVGESIALLFFQLTGLDPTPFTVRLPYALMGALTTGLLFLFVRLSLKNKGLAWLTALLALMNPYHLYISREAYHYSGVALAATIVLWLFWENWMKVRQGRTPGHGVFWGWVLAGLLACHTHMSVWAMFAAQWVLVALAVWKNRSAAEIKVRLMSIRLGILAVLTPLVLSRWIYRAITGFLPNAETKWVDQRGDWSRVIDVITTLLPKFTFGTWWPGLILLGLVVTGLIVLMLKTRHEKSEAPLLATLFVSEFIMLCMVIMVVGKGMASSNYFAPVWPVAMILFAAGLLGVAWLFRSYHRVVVTVSVVVVVAYLAVPAVAVIKLEGKPTPYHKLIKWADRELPHGTIALVDRWYEPWNELQMYRSTNVTFTFTVPDEPLGTFLDNNWRKTVQDFCRQFPEAAFIEMTKNHWATIGAWDWPRKHFTRHAQIRNESGLTLRKYGLATREGFYASNTNRLIIDVFYNTRDDLIERAKAQGDVVMLFYDQGWQYVKPWQQLQSYRDWRMPAPDASFSVYNLNNALMHGDLQIRAVAMNGNVDLMVQQAGEEREFPAGRFQQVDMGNVQLLPGQNRFTLRHSRTDNRNAILLVEMIEITDVEVAHE